MIFFLLPDIFQFLTRTECSVFVFFARKITRLAALNCPPAAVRMQTWRRRCPFKEQRRVFTSSWLRRILIAIGDNKERHGQCWHKTELSEGRGAINVENSGTDSCLFTLTDNIWSVGRSKGTIDFSSKLAINESLWWTQRKKFAFFIILYIHNVDVLNKNRWNILPRWNWYSW